MARGFKRKGQRFVATFDAMERGVVAGLMEQTRELVAPPERERTGDAFEDLVAGLGVSVAADDQVAGPDEVGGVRDPALERILPVEVLDDEPAPLRPQAVAVS